MRDEAEHLRAHVVAVERVHVQPIEQRGRRRHAALLVAGRSDAAVDHRRRGRLAEVVTDRAEHHRDRRPAVESVDARARLVDHHQRVHPDVALRMPLGFLRAADERLELGQQPVDDAEIEREREADRRPVGAAAAASRPRPRRARPADRRAAIASQQRARLRRPRSARIARRTAARAARAGCRRRTSADRRRAAGGARDRRRPSNGSTISPVSGSREIALIVKSRRRAASSTRASGSPCDRESLVAAAGLRLAARQRHVEAADLVDREALADRVDAAERSSSAAQIDRAATPKTSRSRSFGLAAEQLVAHAAADEQRAAAGARTARGDRHARGQAEQSPSAGLRRLACAGRTCCTSRSACAGATTLQRRRATRPGRYGYTSARGGDDALARWRRATSLGRLLRALAADRVAEVAMHRVAEFRVASTPG